MVWNLSLQSSVIDLQITLEKQFTKLHAAVERAREEVWEVLEGELKRAVCQAEGIEAHLQEKICHLKKALVLGGRFSNNTNDVDFMQVGGIYYDMKMTFVSPTLL